MKMNDIELPECASFRLLGLVFTPKFDWKPHVQSVAKQASQRVRSQRYLAPETILYFYKGTICPCKECCSHIWGGASQSGCLDLLDRDQQRRLVNLIGPVLSSTL